jgi:hypothetical protein
MGWRVALLGDCNALQPRTVLDDPFCRQFQLEFAVTSGLAKKQFHMQETEETSILRVLVLILICPDAQSECDLDNKDELLLETSTAYTVPPPAAVFLEHLQVS